MYGEAVGLGGGLVCVLGVVGLVLGLCLCLGFLVLGDGVMFCGSRLVWSRLFGFWGFVLGLLLGEVVGVGVLELCGCRVLGRGVVLLFAGRWQLVLVVIVRFCSG